MTARPIPGLPLGPDRRRLVGVSMVGLVLVGLAGGWWLGRQMGPFSARQPSSQALEQQAATLQQRVDLGQADEREKQRLLQVLVGLNRRQQASRLLEQMADQQPDRWRLRLLLAELRHDLGDRTGAERELRQVLNVLPEQIEALQLSTRLQLEAGRGAEAALALKAIYARQTKPLVLPQALPVGLLLVDLERQLGQTAQAEATGASLAADFPRDPRPLLALALIQQDRGQTREAQKLLQQARTRVRNGSEHTLDRVAAAWGLSSLRRPDQSGDRSSGPASGPAVEARPPVRVSTPGPDGVSPP